VSLRLPEPGSFEDLLRPTRIEVASLVRLSRHPATEPYWSAGVYRFDDPEPGGAGPFGTCYTASTIEVAFAESVIHECGRFVRGSYEVPAAELTERSVVRFTCARRKSLVLADLTGGSRTFRADWCAFALKPSIHAGSRPPASPRDDSPTALAAAVAVH